MGLSVGTTTLAAVGPDRSVTRPPVITRGGAPITDFVDRVGDPVGIVAADGTLHPAATLLAEACADLARDAAGRPQRPRLVLAHPAHWTPAALEAVHRALHRIPDLSDLTLISDCSAALDALGAQAGGVPDRGIIAVCDVGGGGTTITLVDAGRGGVPVVPPLRYPEFSGDLIDQAVLRHVLAQAAPAAQGTGTAAIGPLARLRGQCRAAKERLSAVTVTALPVELTGFRGDIRLTRAELDEMIRTPLAGMIGAVQDMLAHNGIRATELSAVASVGGGAAIPAVTAALSAALRVPVLTTSCPMLAAASGAALQATRPPAAPEPATTALGHPRSTRRPALAWSQAVDVPELSAPPTGERRPAPAAPRPQLEFEPDPGAPEPRVPWYRRPLLLTAAAVLVIAAAGAATAVALRTDSTASPATPSPSVTTAADPPTGQPPPAPEPVGDAPRRTVVAVPAPEPVDAPQPAPPQPAAAPPVTETATVTVVNTPAPVTETVTAEAPPPAEPPPAPAPEPVPAPPPAAPPPITLPTIPPITIPAIPGLPPLFGLPPG